MESPDKREEVELQRRIAASLGSTVRLETTFFPNQLGQTRNVTLRRMGGGNSGSIYSRVVEVA